MKISNLIVILLFLLFPAVLAEGGWDNVMSFYGGASIGDYEQITEVSTNLQKFNQTDGFYRSDANRVSWSSTGMSSGLYTSKANGNQNGTLQFQSATAFMVTEIIAMHEDNTNVPYTLCDTGDLNNPSNATNNTSIRLPGMIPITQGALIGYVFSGTGNYDEAATYNSNHDLQGTNISLNAEGTAPQGSITSVIDSSIVAGQNRKQKVMQFHQYEHGSTLSTSNETEGIEFKGVHKFTGNSYDGPDMPSTWETTTNTTNSTTNQTGVL